jgi:hypothetical protein
LPRVPAIFTNGRAITITKSKLSLKYPRMSPCSPKFKMAVYLHNKVSKLGLKLPRKSPYCNVSELFKEQSLKLSLNLTRVSTMLAKIQNCVSAKIQNNKLGLNKAR